jgi:hypothetical protein
LDTAVPPLQLSEICIDFIQYLTELNRSQGKLNERLGFLYTLHFSHFTPHSAKGGADGSLSHQIALGAKELYE